jgi:SRSO17 transposase
MSLYLQVSLLLSDWITALLTAVPLRSRATFAELLCGCLLSKEGWVTSAISSIQTDMHWTTFYKMLQRGSVKTQALAVALFHLVQKHCTEPILTLVLDDTLVPRQSKDAPGSKIQFDHSRKPNRPSFMQAQVWVTIGVSVVDALGRNCVLPVRSKLVPETGNRSKLRIAEALVRALLPHAAMPVRMLFDAWFMRKNFVLPLVKRNVRFIGRSRHDTALFLPPPPRVKGQRGAGRKYGERITPESRAMLPVTETKLFIYGKEQTVRIQSANAVARFLRGMRVTAVWCQIFDDTKKEWSATKLILSNETDLDAQEIIRLFSRRWGIEPLFHNLKRWWGCKDLWQQSNRVLELWMQMRSSAYVLTQMLAMQLQQSFPMSEVAPWRIGRPVTAGLFLTWLRREYSGLRFRAAFCVKSQQFQWPFSP